MYLGIHPCNIKLIGTVNLQAQLVLTAILCVSGAPKPVFICRETQSHCGYAGVGEAGKGGCVVREEQTADNAPARAG